MKTRSALAIAVIGAASLGLTGCGAGQISQTADQVAAVDGASAETEDGAIQIRDVTVSVTDTQQASLKFTAVNDEKNSGESIQLESVAIDGTPVTVSGNKIINSGCSLIVDSQKMITAMPQADRENMCATYAASSFTDPGAVPGQQREVVFSFSNGDVTVQAPVSKEME